MSRSPERVGVRGGPADERRWRRTWPWPVAAAAAGSWAWHDGMTYAQVHLTFTLPWLVWLAVGAVRAVRAGRPLAGALGRDRGGWIALAALSPVALVYAWPWDRALIARGVWGYPDGRVAAVIGGVPLEELAFFLIQTWLVALAAFAVGRALPPSTAASGGTGAARLVGSTVALALAGAGLLLRDGTATHYLGMILLWAMPVVAVQAAFGGDLLWARRGPFAAAVLMPSAWLWLVDRLAIGWGTWWISEAHTLGVRPLGLPLEEALFFLLASALVAGGTFLCLDPATPGRLRRWAEGVRARPWRALLAVWAAAMVPTPLLPGAFAPLAYLSTGALTLAVLAYALRRYGGRAWALFATALAFGVAIEVIGERTGVPFGAYTYLAPGPAVFGVPLLVPLGWFAFTLIAIAVAPAGRARTLAPLALVAWDLGLDPLMVREGFWAFEVGPYFGVPWSNFVGWYLAGWLLVAALLRIEPRLAVEDAPDLRWTFVAQAFLIGVGLAFFGLPLAGLVAGAAMLAVAALGTPWRVRPAGPA